MKSSNPGGNRSTNDLSDALRSHEIWANLAWQDIRLRYRRSKIGPLWITLSMAIFCLSLGAVYSQLFKSRIAEYMPFLSVGFVFWSMIAGLLGEFPNLYVENAAYIKDMRINPLTILLRVVARHVVVLGHNLLIVIGVYLYFGIEPGWTGLWALPGVALVLMNLIAAGIILSIVGVRFRDVAPITQALIQVVFFVTPITWLPRLLPADSWVTRLNPFAYYLDLMRSPLLGQAPAADSWIASFMTLLFLSAMAATVYRARAVRIPFWV